MAREGVTYEQYKEVADRLKAEGIKPTVRKVRAELGTGSNATLLAHQNHYLEEHHSTGGMTVELPTTLTDAIKRTIIEICSKSTAEIELNYQDAHNQLIEDEKMLTEAERLVTSLKDQLEKKSIQAEQRERELEKSLAATQKQVEELQNQLVILSDKLDESTRAQEIARTESAKAQLQVERADKAAEQAENRADILTKELTRIKSLNTEADKKAATAEAVTKEQDKAITRFEKDLAKAVDVAEKIEKRYDTLLVKHEVVTAEKATATQQAAVAEAMIKNLEEQNNQLKSLFLDKNKKSGQTK